MKILLDECIPYSLYDFLKKESFSVKHVNDLGLSGSLNGKIYQTAKEGFQIFITSDRHFKSRLRFPPTKELGVILIRVNPSFPEEQLKVLKKFLKTHSFEKCMGKLSIIRR